MKIERLGGRDVFTVVVKVSDEWFGVNGGFRRWLFVGGLQEVNGEGFCDYGSVVSDFVKMKKRKAWGFAAKRVSFVTAEVVCRRKKSWVVDDEGEASGAVRRLRETMKGLRVTADLG